MLAVRGAELKPRANPSVAPLNNWQFIIIGGESAKLKGPEKLDSIVRFDIRTGTLDKIETETKHKIVPVYYPCIRLKDDLVVTADYDSGQCYLFDAREEVPKLIKVDKM